MIALTAVLLAGSLSLVAVGALVPGLFSLVLIGFALFTGSALLGMAAHHPGHPRPHH